jgi:hypothetical protein
MLRAAEIDAASIERAARRLLAPADVDSSATKPTTA